MYEKTLEDYKKWIYNTGHLFGHSEATVKLFEEFVDEQPTPKSDEVWYCDVDGDYNDYLKAHLNSKGGLCWSSPSHGWISMEVTPIRKVGEDNG